MGHTKNMMKLVLLAIALFAAGSYALNCGANGGCPSGVDNCLIMETTTSGTASTAVMCDVAGNTGCSNIGSGNCIQASADVRSMCKNTDTLSTYTIPSGTSCPAPSSVGRTATVSFAGLFLALIAFYLN